MLVLSHPQSSDYSNSKNSVVINSLKTSISSHSDTQINLGLPILVNPLPLLQLSNVNYSVKECLSITMLNKPRIQYKYLTPQPPLPRPPLQAAISSMAPCIDPQTTTQKNMAAQCKETR